MSSFFKGIGSLSRNEKTSMFFFELFEVPTKMAIL